MYAKRCALIAPWLLVGAMLWGLVIVPAILASAWPIVVIPAVFWAGGIVLIWQIR